MVLHQEGWVFRVCLVQQRGREGFKLRGMERRRGEVTLFYVWLRRGGDKF